MSKTDSSKLNSDLKAYLDEISDDLYSGHASVMIGAGFSKNAIKNTDGSKSFLDWNGLADVFFHKINGRQPDESDRYLNPMKLAEEVEATFGREILEKLVSDNLPDREYDPSELHDKLIRLPWNNIFVTNYDTLIERATEKSEVRYDIVRNQKNLVRSKYPRVVKLHGSFHSNERFILTEEDYRTYPSKYALFVNTVQQSLVENSLCLIGFSGDDPNFLHWLGWIKDNLGTNHAPRIYLIGSFNLATSKRKLLEHKNITILDYASGLSREKDQHQIAIKRFIGYLHEKEKDKIPLNWPSQEPSMCPDKKGDDNTKDELLSVTKLWRKTREKYPGWVICPYINRIILMKNTEQWVYSGHTKIESNEKYLIYFWYELVWRLERCLFPIKDHFACNINRMINELDPFDEKNKNKEFKVKWFYLGLALLRFYREKGQNKAWQKLYEKLNSVQGLYDDLRVKLLFEECNFFLYSNDVNKLPFAFEKIRKEKLKPFEKARLSSMLAEFGNINEANSLIEESLNSIRLIQNLKPVTNNYQHLSEESLILEIQKTIKNAKFLMRDDRPSSDDIKKDWEYENYVWKRLDNLKKYKCDPWVELKYFILKLTDRSVATRPIEVKGDFDIGYRTVSHKPFKIDAEVLLAYNLLRLMEDASLPFNVHRMTTLGQDSIQGAILRIQVHFPSWAFSVLVRSGDSKSVNKVFDRETIAKLSFNEVNELLESFLSMMDNSAKLIERYDPVKKANIGTRIANVVPEIISRLISKANRDNSHRVLDLLKMIYISNEKFNYSTIGRLLKRTIKSWPRNDYNYLVNFILDHLAPIEKKHPYLLRDFHDPLTIIDTEEIKNNNIQILVKPSKIDCLLSSFERLKAGERYQTFLRLAALYDLEMFTQEQSERFGEILWSHRASDNFPELRVPKSDFMYYPCPQNINLSSLLKNHLLSLKLPYQKDDSISKNAFSDFFSEFENSFRFLGTLIPWNENDALELLNKVLNWYESDKKFYYECKEQDIFFKKQDFIDKFYMGVELISYASIPFISNYKLDEQMDKLLLFAEEISSNNISASRLLCQILIKNSNKTEMLKLIKHELSSNDYLISTSATIAIKELVESAFESPTLSKFKPLWKLLEEIVYWRKYPQLPLALQGLSVLISENKEFLDNVNMENLLFGLKWIRVDGESENSRDISFDSRLEARRNAAELAFNIYKYYSDKKIAIPGEILRWKEVMQSEDEFYEVKKFWT